MRKPVKQAFLYLSRAAGLFALARFMTRRRLRILCFHGGSVHDEHLFLPGVFMREETIRQRLEILAHHGYPILDLGTALNMLAENRLPPCGTVITIDDGFYSTFSQAAKLLREFHFPATVYVTTYYAMKQTPIFRLAVSYMFWKTRETTLDTAGLLLERTGSCNLSDPVERKRVCWEIIGHAEERLEEHQRGELAHELARRLGIDYQGIIDSRAFHLMTDHEIRTLVNGGIDIQLHTHRHRLPIDPELAAREVVENRAYLEDKVNRPLEHLCYPSGIWSEELVPCLESLGVTSATTCDPGLNDTKTPPLALRRFLDAEDISRIEFEAELCGFADLLRGTRSRLMRLRKSNPASAASSQPASHRLPEQAAVPVSGGDK